MAGIIIYSIAIAGVDLGEGVGVVTSSPYPMLIINFYISVLYSSKEYSSYINLAIMISHCAGEKECISPS